MKILLIPVLAALTILGFTFATPKAESSIKIVSSAGLNAHITSLTSSTVTVGWTPAVTASQGAEGYVFKVGSKRVSSTWDPTVSSVRFSIKSGTNTYGVFTLIDGPSGSVIVPVPTTTVTTTVTSTTTSTTVTTTPNPVSSFVSQSTLGNGDGTSCANAKSVSYFNTHIYQPGDSVGICGTITTSLGIQGSGTSANPIRIVFQPGSKISKPFCDPCLNIYGGSYITVDGNHVGIIEATDNGTNFSNYSAGEGIVLQNTNHIIIANLAIRNLYVHTSLTDYPFSSKEQYAISDWNGNDNQITGNTIHDTQLGVSYRTDDPTYGHNMRVDHNEFYNIDNPVNQTYGFGGGAVGPFFFDHNYSHDFAAWDTTDNAYHHDGVHCYTSANGTGAAVHSVGNYYYNNKFLANGGAGGRWTSMFFIERGSGPGSTPCDDSTSNNYFFNNVLIDATDLTPVGGVVGISNGVMGAFSGSNHVYNNTMVGAVSQNGGPSVGKVFGDNVDMQNNVFVRGDQLINSSAGIFNPTSPDYNLYGNAGWNTFICHTPTQTFFYNQGQFDLWQNCVGGAKDQHSAYFSDPGIGPDGVPLPNSPAIGFGKNLSSLCVGNLVSLCQNYDGSQRSTTGNWNAGAF